MKKKISLFIFNLINLSIIIGILSQSLKSNLYGLTSNMDYVVARKTLGGHDSGSYLEGSLQLLGLSEKSQANDFVWQLWPPGMSSSLFILSKSNYLFQHALLAGALIQVISIMIIQNNLRVMISIRSRSLSFLLPTLFLVLYSPYRDWLLGYGLLYAEGPALAFLTLSIVVLYKREQLLDGYLIPFRLKSFVLTEKWLLGSAGFLFGVAAYFRGPFDTMVQACFIAWVLICLTNRVRGKSQMSLNGAGIFFGSYFIVTLPWRFFSYLVFNIPLFSWTSLSGDANWAYIPNKELIENGQEAWAHGNLNWACELVTTSCGRSVQYGVSDLIHVIMSNPWDFFLLRTPQLIKTLALPGSELYPWNGPYNFMQSAVWLITFSLAIFLLLHRLIQNKLNFYDFVILFSVTSTVLLILFTHFENRYFLPATLLLGIFLGSYKRLDTTHN